MAALFRKITMAATRLIDTGVATTRAFPHLEKMAEQEDQSPTVRRFTKRRIFGAVFLLSLILLAIAWMQRFRLADDLIRDQLQSQGVRATYQIDEIGLRTERLKNVVLGDPANPDLTAKLVEVDVALGLGTPTIRAVRASGVRLRGRIINGTLSFGELDKFRDPLSKEPFALPDFSLALNDAILSLETPWGGVGASLQGSGHLRDGFSGNLVVRAPQLASADCSADLLGYDGSVRISGGQPTLQGPLTAAALKCPGQGVALAGAALNGKIKLSERFDNWDGDVSFAINNARLSGQQFSAVQGKLSVFGGRARTDFELALAKAGYRGYGLAVRQLSGDAEGRFAFATNGLSVSARGGARLAGGAVDQSYLSGIGGIAKGTKATPVGPLTAALEPALREAARSFDGSLSYDVSISPAKSAIVVVDTLKLTSRSGARVAQTGPLSLSGGRLAGPVSLSLSGGGLPEADLALRQQAGGWAGTLALSPYAAGNASLSLPRLAFAASPAGAWRFDGQATLSGPLMGGRIEGLSLPIDGSFARGAFSMLSGCRQVRFARFQTGSLMLPAQSLQACASDGSIIRAGRGGAQFSFNAPSLGGRGTLGNSPIAFQGSNVRFDLSDGFVASNVAVDLGTADALTKFKMASLGGRLLGNGALAGTLTNGSGNIGNVPLLIENANGNWSWRDSILMLDGAANILDAQQVDRFKPLVTPDMQVVLADGVISATGHLQEPSSGIRVADVDIKHTLSIGRGRALFAVDNLRFGDRLPIEKLTPLTLGAIANLEGTVVGDGAIEWDRDGVRSRGNFSTDGLDFAAAFGPVTGLKTDINFTDLLNLETAPSQVARIAIVNPGVPAFDGTITYRLLPDQKVQIESGRWPFYGGELILEPTLIDFDVSKPRNLTFRLVGLDAEKFLASYDLENLRVSGVFDGTLPMVFDADGGRITGGWLVSRSGGEVSYLGQLSYEDMGTMANFAFEALRSIKFDEMQIGVNGNIGGEVVTEVRFRGLQQGSVAKRSYITKQLAKLPIEFNVRIEAEFLQLIGSLRALYDAEYAAQRYKGMLDTPPPVTGEKDGE
jgi:translocation and assembly module TamB